MAIGVIGRLAIGDWRLAIIGQLPIIVDWGYRICKFEQETALLVLAVAGFCAIRETFRWLMVIGRLAIGTGIIGQLPIIGDWDKQISAGI